LGQQLYKQCIQNEIILEHCPSISSIDASSPSDLLQPVYSGFTLHLLKPCQKADFFYDIAYRLFSVLCDGKSASSAPAADDVSAARESAPTEDVDVRNKVTVQCNKSCMRRSLSSRLADAIFARCMSCVSCENSMDNSGTVTTMDASNKSNTSDNQSNVIAMAMARVIDTGENTTAFGDIIATTTKKKNSHGKHQKSTGITVKVNTQQCFFESTMKSALVMCSPIEYLEDAISMCIEYHILTSQGTCQPIGYALQSECGLNYLAKGKQSEN
jgi:hypothetical protein